MGGGTVKAGCEAGACRCVALLAMSALGLGAAGTARPQTEVEALPYSGPPTWQDAAVATLNRHLPSDSGYWVLGPLDPRVDLPDTMDLVRTTLRILAPDAAAARAVTRNLWLPTGGVALEELQPSDTLPHALPPGYPGRFVKGTVAGESVLLQVFTVQEHRWLLWADRVGVSAIREAATGPVARFSEAVAAYLGAGQGVRGGTEPPRAAQYGLDASYDLYPPPPGPVVGSREGYLDLLASNRAFTLDEQVKGVYGVMPGPSLVEWLESEAPELLFPSKDGAAALQHRFRDYLAAGGRWTGFPILSGASLDRMSPGRYVYVVDRYGFVRVAAASGLGPDAGGTSITAALLAQGEPVRVAGVLTVVAGTDRKPKVGAANIRSPEYFFSNLALTLYEDVQSRSDGYVLALGHLLSALDAARVPHDEILLTKF